MNSQLEKASLWKKKLSIVEPTSVYDNDERMVERNSPKVNNEDKARNVESGKETNQVEMPPPSRSTPRETFKQRAQQRQREIDQMKMMLRVHQPSRVDGEFVNLNEKQVDRIQKPTSMIEQRQPFDFERMEKEHEIDSRFDQFCKTHNRLSKKQTGLLRASTLQYEENTKRRFQPSCKSRRLQSESGSLSLVSKTPQQLQRILGSLDEQCIPATKLDDVLLNHLQDNNVVDSPMVEDSFFFKQPSSFPIINHPNRIDFDEEPFNNKKSYTVMKTGNSTIQFSQWKSVFSKNNK
ncbi:predicted protein [Naegleria gruberi]|uniref:Predicted protein n=1 Tax=Naegleria gruberi TaxID=5762 RepID=D2VZQ2_NAEGR|nr:uncharacterized protein NAEGRDRAFT_53562 [Naegleria gruberi]EFC37736.1 predicted protein [Naegleria gruberi]|eukprot:XP_002670480.1 predicted protein [Naegleria gruberi strain NEG-M]